MKVILVLAISLFFSVSLVAKESPEYLLKYLPESMLFFEAGKIRHYNKPELGASRKYSKELRSSTTWASVYIYDQGFENISQKIVEKSYEKAYQDVKAFYSQAIRIDENRGSWNLKLNKSRNMKINYAWFEIAKGGGSKISTYLFVAGDDHYIYKIRISSEKLNKNKFPNETLPSKKISAGPEIIYFVEGILESIDSKLNGALDEDLETPDVPSLEGKVVMSRHQLDSLARVVESIAAAALIGMISGEELFTSSWKAELIMARDPNKMKQAQRMADTGLLPEFLEGISYQSQLMSMTNKLWNSWSANKRAEFIDTLNEKVETYHNIRATPEVWIQLNKGDGVDEYVYPLSFDLLP